MHRRTRRPFLYLAGFLVIIAASSLSLFSLSSLFSKEEFMSYVPLRDYIKEAGFKHNFYHLHNHHEAALPEPLPWDSSSFLVGEPTTKFRDNLRNNTNYITAWSNAGFTNQFMGYINLIYLAILTDRVPVMPPFAPDHHISREGGVIPFGEIFNLTHLRLKLQKPILEWKDVKQLPSSRAANPYGTTEVEDIGCWSTRPESNPDPHRATNLVHHLGLDPSYTRVPSYMRKNEQNSDDNHIVFSKLAALLYPLDPIEPPVNFPIMKSSWGGKGLLADEWLTCVDVLYYMTSGAEVFEWRFSWSPAWNFVGKHATFNQWLIERSKGYLRKAFELDDREEIPPFIAVHIRHGDFADQCSIPGHCLNSVKNFVATVKKMEQALLQVKGVTIRHWLVSSDETDSSFWEEIKELRWSFFDHEKEQTLERFGEWQTPLVDVVAHSLASGFVGTWDSTFSLVSGRRVEDWNHGPYQLVS